MVFNETLMQFQADMLGVPLQRPAVAETTALGAYAAGLAVGFWNSADELRAHASVARQWQPQMASRMRATLYAKWKKAVTRSFN